MKTSKSIICLLTLIFAMAAVCPGAGAHDTWITMDPHTLGNGSSAAFAIFNSHMFPAGKKEHLAADRLEAAFFITPEGKQVPVSNKDGKTYVSETPLATQGTYLAVAIPENGFWTKTTEGYQRGKTKRDLSNVIQCRFSEKYAKAVFAAGQPGGEIYSRPLGDTLEIVPLKDPATLKTGELLPVKVLLEGKPAMTFVYGTYKNFSEYPNTFAYTTRTDQEGLARIKILHSGDWLLVVKHERPYPDAAVCDKKAYAASLTFHID